MRLFIPEVKGIMILTPDGLPFDFASIDKTTYNDPIIAGGFVSFAVTSLQRSLDGLGDNSFDLTYVKGENLAMVVGKVGDFYMVIMADAETKLGPLFMEFRRRKEQISQMLEGYIKG